MHILYYISDTGESFDDVFVFERRVSALVDLPQSVGVIALCGAREIRTRVRTRPEVSEFFGLVVKATEKDSGVITERVTPA